ncbi:LANO_0H14994g1_1 [Lachancea nothofagi CBS 11611]|uniref:DNA-directed RNA polymerases I, II, and III subunit RPABC3 n=1 Tax=Lachancea nothofagi CBS 11611 TaxID=1266666 RepID=A0A1G4KMW1_9SACH|nr:LANO_0H14994g1_1 [Lachancea nothofagi CBS 11611]
MSTTLFDDIFQVTEVDQGRYNKISRIEAHSTSQEFQLTLDVNTELFPIRSNDTLTVMVSSSLSIDGTEPVQGGSWRAPQVGERSLADDYDYVMYGTAYRFEEVAGKKDLIAVHYSFGGLLMRLEGNYRGLSNLKQENAYLLIRR